MYRRATCRRFQGKETLKMMKSFGGTIALLYLTVASATTALAQSNLDAELKALYEKYGRDSVVRKVERDNPKAADAAPKSKAPEDAAAAKDSEGEKGGFRLSKQQRFPLLFRRSYSDVTAGEDPSAPDPKSLREAEAAQFSYSHDYLAQSDQWSIAAAVIMPMELINNNDQPASQEGLELQILDFVPSVSLNRITNNKDATKEVDELTFRAGLFSKWLGIVGPLRLLKLSAYATYATNSGFHDGGIVAGEVDLEPITTLPGNRTFYRLAKNGTGKEGRAGSLIEYHWRTYLHSEFGGHVGDAPGQVNEEDFFRVGPVLSLQLDPFFLQRTNASISYTYLAGLSGGPASSHHLLAKLGVILDRTPDTDHWTLNATYEDGDTPLVKNHVRTFLLSLGIKY
jgi:hypothetical protein